MCCGFGAVILLFMIINSQIKDQNNLKLLESDSDLFIQRAAQSPTLNQVIYTYQNQLNELVAKKTNLESHANSDEIFQLSQEKDNLQLELEFLMQQNPIKTQLIGKIVTIDAGIKKGSIIFVSFILGLFLSIVIVLINKTLKAFTED